jgi:hypothetical protein
MINALAQTHDYRRVLAYFVAGCRRLSNNGSPKAPDEFICERFVTSLN